MTAAVLRRRLSWLEIPLFIAAIFLFWFMADRKDLGYAVGVVAGIWIVTLAFLKPRWGLIFAMVLLFTESTINTLNTVAETALESELSGVPAILQTIWFAWGVLILYVVLLLSYFSKAFLAQRRIRPLSALEWILLLPLMAVLTYLPVSMIFGNQFSDYLADIIPMLIYGGIVALARVFSLEKNVRESRYFFLDWFIIFNLLILLPLWGYNIAVNPWRDGSVAITAIRHGTGPYDFNFFLVPLLGMILTYDDKLTKKRRLFYEWAFFISLVRIVVSMFRGAIGGTLLAIVIASLLVESGRRWRWVKSLLVFSGAVVILGAIAIATVPVVRTTFNVALVKRINQAINQGAGSGSLKFRELETEDALDKIMLEPFTGYGPGAMVVKNFNENRFARVELYLHSGYVWFWYKLGVLGIVVLIAFFLGIYGTCIYLLRRKLHPPDRGWVIGTFAATVAMLPVIHTNNMLIRSQGAYALTMLLFGLSLIVMRYQGVPRDSLPEGEGVDS
jgi:O-antigen ligase